MFYGWFDTIFSMLFPIAFLCCLGIFLFTLVSNLRSWNQNNHAPKLSVPAAVVAKRTQVSHSNMASAGDMTSAHRYTVYYVTFQVESGDRMEFAVSGTEYGMLVEGDIGKRDLSERGSSILLRKTVLPLKVPTGDFIASQTRTFQGTRYLGFARK